MDSKALQTGEDFERLPEAWVIFITESDVLGGGQPLYHFERRTQDGARVLGDGSHIIYVNGALRDAGTALGDLVHDFFCRNPGHMRLAQLAQDVQRFKVSEEGVREMSSVMEEIREEMREELREEVRGEVREEALRDTARQMLRMGGFGVDVIARITSLDEDVVRSLAAQEQGHS